MKKILLLVLTLLLLAGCAEEVVKKEVAPSEMTVTVYLRGDVDSTIYKYYLIFSTNSGIKLPNLAVNNPLILRPGEDYDPTDIQNYTGNPADGIEFYYKNFFSTWVDVVQYNNSQFTIVIPQGLYPNTATANEHTTLYNDTVAWSVQNMSAGAIIKAKFNIEAIKSGIDTKEGNDRIYFNFIAADKIAPGTKGGLIYDYLDSEPSIINKAGKQVSEYDASNDETKPAGADIIRWSVHIK